MVWWLSPKRRKSRLLYSTVRKPSMNSMEQSATPQGQGGAAGFSAGSGTSGTEGRTCPHKVDQKDDQAAQLGPARGQGAARHPPSGSGR